MKWSTIRGRRQRRLGRHEHARTFAEPLERRLLLASLVEDILPGPGSTDYQEGPRDLVEHDGILYFTADDGVHGRELWRSDGTADGTWMIKDIRAGLEGADIGFLTPMGSRVYFRANDGISGDELWWYDTTDGLCWQLDLSPGPGGYAPGNIMGAFGELYFAARGSAQVGTEPWCLVPATGYLASLGDLRPGSASSDPMDFTRAAGRVFFTAVDGTNTRRLWSTDGTPYGTAKVSAGPTTIHNPGELVSLGDYLYFTAEDPTGGRELWRSDGTTAGQVLDLRPGVMGSNPAELTILDGVLYFLADHDGDTYLDLFRSNGTATGTSMVKAVHAGPHDMVAARDLLFFEISHALWRSDGTADGTYMVKDGFISPLANLAAVGNLLLFAGKDGPQGYELWRSDGTAEGTFRQSILAWPDRITDVGGRAFMSGFVTTSGYELWVEDATTRDDYEENDSKAITDGRPAGGIHSPNFGPIDEDVEISWLSTLDDPTDWYKFSTYGPGGFGDRVEINVTNYRTCDLDLVVYRADGVTEVGRSEGGSSDWVCLDGQPMGTYYAKVYGAGAPNSNYTLKLFVPEIAADRFEVNDRPTDATDLGVLGDWSEAHLSIHGPGDMDYFRFTAAGDGPITIAAGSHDPYNGGLVLELEEADHPGYPIGQFRGDKGNLNVTLTATVEGGKDYRFLVAGYNGKLVSDYRLGIDAPGPQIKGTKWSDLNGNGVRDEGEPGLAGWTIFLDENDNGALDPGERSALTDANGNYAFADLDSRVYWVAEMNDRTGWRQTFPATPSMGPQVEVSSLALSSVPSASMDDLGNAIIVWASWPRQVYARTLRASGGWDSGAVEVNTATSDKGWSPCVAMDRAGRAVVVWDSQPDPGAWDVRARALNQDGTWGDERIVNSTTASHQIAARVAMDDLGHAMAVWQSLESDGLFGTTIRASTCVDVSRNDWGADFVVNQTEQTSQRAPAVAMDALGNAIVVWEDWVSTHQEVYARQRGSSGTWGSDFVVGDDGDYGTFLLEPQVAMDSFGNALVVWYAGTKSIIGRWYNIAQGWSDGFTINTSSASSYALPAVALDDFGNAIVAWSADRGDGEVIVVRRYHPSVGWSDEQVVSQAGSGGPGVALSNSGHAIVTWIGPDSHVYASTQGQDSGMHAVDLTYGSVSGVDFGNAPPTSISGTIWNDVDADRSEDPGEGSLAGWTVFLDINGNGSPDAEEQTDTTSENGHFEFAGLAMGVYRVAQVLPEGWKQSCPDTGSYLVKLAGSDFPTANFGNYLPSQSPHGTLPVDIAWPSTRIEAERFDWGGEGTAYHDTGPGNTGGAFRTSEDVDIQACGDVDGSYNVGWTDAGEWLEYTVEVLEEGMYQLQLRAAMDAVAGPYTNVHLAVDSRDVTGPMPILPTGGWQAYQTFTSQHFWLSGGIHVLHLQIDETGTLGYGPNVNWLQLVGPQNRFASHTANGLIQAEDFDEGGQGVAYSDNDDGVNHGGVAYRTGGVDIEPTGDLGGGYNVGWFGPPEWLEYTIYVESEDDYTLEFRAASGIGAQFDYGFGMSTRQINLAPTGGWQNWQTLASESLHLARGLHVLRIGVISGGLNLNWIRLRADGEPFNGIPFPVPGMIQAEEYDLGANGIAYYDDSPGNAPLDLYRAGDDVDIDGCDDIGGTYSIGYVRGGEWLTYTIDVLQTGDYDLEFRVAHPGAGGVFQVDIDDMPVADSIVVPDTGGWQAYQTVTCTSVSLAAGEHVMRLLFNSGGDSGFVGNLSWIRITPHHAPYAGMPAAIPGRIEAENYDWGANGVAYADADAMNNGTGGHRSWQDVDIRPVVDGEAGGQQVGWTAVGEWLDYTIDVPVAGLYDIGLRVACGGPGGQMHLEFRKEGGFTRQTSWISIPDTGGWDAWQTLAWPMMYLDAGVQVMRVRFDSAGPTGLVGDLNWIDIQSSPDEFRFTTGVYSAGEASGGINITVERVGGLAGSSSVRYRTESITAAAGSDYVGMSGVLEFTPGESSGTFFVPILDDPDAEADETLRLILEDPSSGASLGVPATATLTIVDNDLPSITIEDASAAEGDGGEVNVQVTVRLSAPSTRQVTVELAPANGTAIASGDYYADSLHIIFDPGQVGQKIEVWFKGDTLYELDEAFQLNLSGPVNAAIADGQATITIQNDDPMPSLSIDDPPDIVEGDSGTRSLSFRVRLSAPSGVPATVRYFTADGTATTPADYAAIPTTVLTFDPGQTEKLITVLVNGDRIAEGEEVFYLNLANATGAVIADHEARGVITDDDVAGTIRFAQPSFTAAEGDSATITVTRSGGTAGGVTVRYATGQGSATPGVDFMATSGTLTFGIDEMSKSFAVSTASDMLFEGNEALVLLLQDAQGLPIDTAVLTIVDDDPLQGTAGSDKVKVQLKQGGGHILIVVNEFTHEIALADLARLLILGGEGEDELTIDPINGWPAPAGGLSFLGEQDDDQVILTGLPPGTSGGQMLFDGGDGVDTLITPGSDGNDVFTLSGIDFTWGGVNVSHEGIEEAQIFGGAGNDGLSLIAATPIQLPKPRFDGGEGNDTLTFTGTLPTPIPEPAFFGGGGYDLMNVIGGDEDDTFTLGGETFGWGGTNVSHSGLEEVAIAGGRGNDSLLHIAATPIQLPRPKFEGGEGNDTFRIRRPEPLPVGVFNDAPVTVDAETALLDAAEVAPASLDELLGTLGQRVLEGELKALLWIPGLVAGANEKDYGDWLPIDALALQAVHPVEGQPSVGGLRLLKQMDLASPMLLNRLVDDVQFGPVTLEVRRPLELRDVTWLRLELTDSRLLSYALEGLGGWPREEIVLDAHTVKATYTRFDEAGQKVASVERKWEDVESDLPAANTPLRDLLPPSGDALPAFLHIGSLMADPGTPDEPQYANWSRVRAFAFEAVRPAGGPLAVSELRVVKDLDLVSPALIERLRSDRPQPRLGDSVNLDVCIASATGPMPVLRLGVTGPFLAGYALEATGPSAHEEIRLTGTERKIECIEYDASGTRIGSSTSTFPDPATLASRRLRDRMPPGSESWEADVTIKAQPNDLAVSGRALAFAFEVDSGGTLTRDIRVVREVDRLSPVLLDRLVSGVGLADLSLTLAVDVTADDVTRLEFDLNGISVVSYSQVFACGTSREEVGLFAEGGTYAFRAYDGAGRPAGEAEGIVSFSPAREDGWGDAILRDRVPAAGGPCAARLNSPNVPGSAYGAGDGGWIGIAAYAFTVDRYAAGTSRLGPLQLVKDVDAASPVLLERLQSVRPQDKEFGTATLEVVVMVEGVPVDILHFDFTRPRLLSYAIEAAGYAPVEELALRVEMGSMICTEYDSAGASFGETSCAWALAGAAVLPADSPLRERMPAPKGDLHASLHIPAQPDGTTACAVKLLGFALQASADEAFSIGLRLVKEPDLESARLLDWTLSGRVVAGVTLSIGASYGDELRDILKMDFRAHLFFTSYSLEASSSAPREESGFFAPAGRIEYLYYDVDGAQRGSTPVRWELASSLEDAWANAPLRTRLPRSEGELSAFLTAKAIPGEATNADYRDAIRIHSLAFDVARPLGETTQPIISEFEMQKAIDLASLPMLDRLLSAGETPSMTLDLCAYSGDLGFQDFLRFDLYRTRATGYEAAEPAAIGAERLAIDAMGGVMTWTSYDAAGRPRGQTSADWGSQFSYVFDGGEGHDVLGILAGDEDDTFSLDGATFLWDGISVDHIALEEADIQGGGGNDALSLIAATPIQLPKPRFDGGEGNDTLTFTGSLPVPIPEPAFFGGGGYDVMNVIAGEEDDVFTLSGETLGWDGISMDHTAVEEADIQGGGGNDALSLIAATPIQLPKPRFDGGEGNDTLSLIGVHPIPIPEPVFYGGGGIDAFEMVDTQCTVAHSGFVDVERIASIGQSSAVIDSPVVMPATLLDGGEIQLAPGGDNLMQTGDLQIQNQGTLDLADNALVITGTAETCYDAYDDAVEWVRSARNQPELWSGTGITSSAATTCPQEIRGLTGLAVILNDDGHGNPILPALGDCHPTATDVIVMYTWNGDANLSGTVDGNDYLLIDRGFLTQAGGYRNGDLDYSGRTDGDDYFLVDGAFIGQQGVLRNAAAAQVFGTTSVASTAIEADAGGPALPPEQATEQVIAFGEAACFAPRVVALSPGEAASAEPSFVRAILFSTEPIFELV